MSRHHRAITMWILLSLFVLLAGVMCLLGFMLPAQFSETFLGELPAKVELLRSSTKNRIILVGGSSVPFSTKSQLIATEFPDYDIIDFGLYADIGTPLMLDLLEEELREGDIVIISAEQDAQALSTYFNAESLWQAIDGAFPLLKNLSAQRFEKLLAAFPVFAGKKLYYSIYGAPLIEGIYARSSFNAYGNIQSDLRDCNIMANGYDPNQMIRFSPEIINEDFIHALNDFTALCQEKDVAVYYRFPPMNRSAISVGEEEKLNNYYDVLKEKLDFPILGDPHRSIMDSGWFYDTNFHLNDSGATVFTKMLIEDLKIIFQDTSVTDITLPSMPAPSGGQVISGNDSHADLFTYRLEGQGWIITGLSRSGLSVETVIAPTFYQNLPVTGIDPNALAGQTNLKSITLQANIKTLHNGMFAGCSNLKQLILTGKPSDYTAGDQLMQGADFLILVQPSQVSQFRRHYSWQKYSQYIISGDESLFLQ